MLMCLDKPRFEDYTYLARHYANNYRGMLKEYPSIEFDDLYQEALIALEKACRLYDPTKNVNLKYIAAVWMKQAMITMLKSKGKTYGKKWCKDEKLDDEEQGLTSLITIPSETCDIDEIEIMDGEDNDEDDAEQFIKLDKSLEKLSIEDQYLLIKYYGLGRTEKLTLKSIGELKGISKERAGQRVRAAKQRLQNIMLGIPEPEPEPKTEARLKRAALIACFISFCIKG